MLFELQGFVDLACVLKAESGKFYIIRPEPGILFISLPIGLLFKSVIMTYLSFFASIHVI